MCHNDPDRRGASHNSDSSRRGRSRRPPLTRWDTTLSTAYRTKSIRLLSPISPKTPAAAAHPHPWVRTPSWSRATLKKKSLRAIPVPKSPRPPKHHSVGWGSSPTPRKPVELVAAQVHLSPPLPWSPQDIASIKTAATSPSHRAKTAQTSAFARPKQAKSGTTKLAVPLATIGA